jgi:hypothetical protein
VVAAPPQTHEGGTAATRAYPLYRYLVKNTLPAEVEGRVYLARPDRVARLRGEEAPAAEAQDLLLDKVFLVGGLKALPRSWGSSFTHLERQLRRVAPLAFVPGRDLAAAAGGRLEIRGRDPVIRADLGSLGLAGEAAGLLRLSVACHESPLPGPFAAVWSGDGGRKSGRVTFDNGPLGEGELLIPLDAQPRWLTAKKIEKIEIELGDPGLCTHLTIRQATLYQRTIVDEMKKIGADP